jgi:hypothetical protein
MDSSRSLVCQFPGFDFGVQAIENTRPIIDRVGVENGRVLEGSWLGWQAGTRPSPMISRRVSAPSQPLSERTSHSRASQPGCFQAMWHIGNAKGSGN